MRPVAVMAVAVALTACGLGLAAADVPVAGTTLRKVINWRSDGPDPIYTPGLSARAIRAAGRRLRGGGTYFVDAPGRSQLQVNSIVHGLLLFALPAVPVRESQDADWIVRYGSGERVADVRDRIRVSPEIELLRVR